MDLPIAQEINRICSGVHRQYALKSIPLFQGFRYELKTKPVLNNRSYNRPRRLQAPAVGDKIVGKKQQAFAGRQLAKLRIDRKMG